MPTGTCLLRHGDRPAAIHLAGPAATRPHRLPMARLVVPLEPGGAVEVETAAGPRRFEGPCALPPDLACVVRSGGAALTVFVDPLAPSAASLPRIASERPAALLWAARAVQHLERDAEAFLGAILPKADGRRTIDPRVRRAVAWLDEHPEAPWSMRALAGRVGLSPTRLAHLFQSEIGVSARVLALHHRVLFAVEAVLAGRGLADAAAEAGFSDQAHFGRACVRLLGQPPGVIRDGPSGQLHMDVGPPRSLLIRSRSR